MSSTAPPSPPRSSLLDLPETARVAPFFLFLALGSFQGAGFAGADYWMYAAKTLAAGALLWAWRKRIPEMRFSLDPVAIAVGLAVALVWGVTEERLPGLGSLFAIVRHWATGQPPAPYEMAQAWNPVAFFAGAPLLGWGFVAVRVAGRSIVVPAMEEVFYRSLVYRLIISPDFMSVALGTIRWGAILAASGLFAVVHPDQWAPAFLTGLAYQGLLARRGRLGDPMLAHGVTNLALSLWTIATGRWQFN